MTMNIKKRGLGKGFNDLGLNELLSSINGSDSGKESASSGELRKLPIEVLQPGKYQPRRDMDPEALADLADSIRSQGIIQPIVVRPIAQKGHYEIIAGERRWRAAQLAQLAEVPVMLRDIPDEAALAVALIENIQREDLNAIEEAITLQRLIEEFSMTHQEIAETIGKSRTAVSNLLRLLSLNEDVKTMVQHGDLEMGHARAILALDGTKQSQIAKQVVDRQLSVRETESLIRKLQTISPDKTSAHKADPDVQRLEMNLADTLGTEVAIRYNNKGKGQLVIQFSNFNELEGILAHIK